MKAAGCEALASSGELAVMGFVEPLRHLPRLLRLRSRLLESFSVAGLDAFIGIDSPAFNLGLARKLRSRGLADRAVCQPAGLAWRPGRVKKIAASVDSVLCLLPFESAFYAEHAVQAQFVGHPLADQVPLQVDREAARATLGCAPDTPVVALLPAAVKARVRRLGADFAAAARELAASVRRCRASSPRWPIRMCAGSSPAGRRGRRRGDAAGRPVRPGAGRRDAALVASAPRRWRPCCTVARWWSPTASRR